MNWEGGEECSFVIAQGLFVMREGQSTTLWTNAYLCKRNIVNQSTSIIMKDFIGEMLGTFVLTLMGCCSVAVAVLFGEYNSIFQIGLVWGLGVTLAIFLTRNICCAHLNPAVSVAMVLA